MSKLMKIHGSLTIKSGGTEITEPLLTLSQETQVLTLLLPLAVHNGGDAQPGE